MTNLARVVKHALYKGSDQAAWALFASAPAVRFAVATDAGVPLSRTLSAVVIGDRLCFHGGDEGDKHALIGRAACATYDEVVAQVPSYWIHPELACPASTYYLSAHAEGTIARIDDRARKAEVLSALMAKYQPEGGFEPITAGAPRYAKVLDALLVAELVPTHVACRNKLGQQRSPTQITRVLAGLWQRGQPGDLRALRLVREGHPERPTPAFLRGPEGSTLCAAPDADDALAVARMLVGQYWTDGFSVERMASAQRGSAAWVVARGPDGRVLASARAVSDAARFGYVLDVIVLPELRGRGFGKALMRLLLDHPAMRGLLTIGLRTRDAQALYRGFGFDTANPRGEEMVLRRP